MNKKMKKKLYKIIISGILFLIAFLLRIDNKVVNNILFIISYIIVGKEILEKAFKNITRGKVFDENFLMTVATLGAFLIGEYPEAVAVMLFYQIGELFQIYAVDKSRKSVAALMDIRPDYANLLDDGKEIKANPEKVNIGDVIIIKPGEKIPIDGVVIEGNTSLNTFALTGETVPREVGKKDEVLSGSINNEGLIKVKTTKKFSDSTVSKILDLVENASSKKSNSENFISKFAKYYTPIVVVIALTLCIFPPIILNQKFTTWIYRGLSFLVVSCPCALVVSIPLSFFGGIGASSKIGVLIKGSNYLESLSKTETIICDKTGTLTEGVFEVQKIEPVDISEKELLKYAAYTEHFSNHPISMSLKKAYGKKIDSSKVTNTKEISGKGVIATIDNKEIIVGNEKILKDENIKYVKSEEVGTIIYIAIDKKFAGTIVISDKINIEGFQISQTNWGLRTVSSVEPEIDGRKVVEYGNIYAVDNGEVKNKDMVVGSTSKYVAAFKSTEKGIINKKFSASDTATNYVMTMEDNGSTKAAYTQEYRIRGYAKLSDGSYVYSSVSYFSIYRVSKLLYDNCKMSTNRAHEYLYNNILKVVDPEYKPVDYNWGSIVVRPE